MKPLNIYAFSDEAGAEIDKQIIALKRNGLDGMEIRNVDGTNVSDITADKAKEVKAKLDDNGLCVWSVGSPIGKIGIEDDFNAHLDVFKRTLQTANILGAKNMRIFSFYIPQGADAAPYKQAVLERLNTLAELAKDHGVALCHENEKGIYGDTPQRCLEIFTALPAIKGIFDPANYIQCGVDTLQAWAQLKPYIHYLHIKDAAADGVIVPAGDGVGNIQTITHEFMAQGGRHVTMEPHLMEFSGLANLERAGENSHIGAAYADSDTAFDVACNRFKALL